MSPDNEITNAAVEAGTLPESQRETVPQVSEEGRAAAGRIAAARAKADNTITSESLAPQAEVQVTDPQTGTAMAGLGGALEAQTDSFAQGLTDTRNQREAEKNQSRNDYSSLVANRTGLEGFSLQADQDAGVFEADSALQDINNELRTEQLGRRRSVEALQGQGNLKGTTQSQVNNINRESYSKQADMAIVQLAAQGRFNSASALADRKANAMFEQEQNQIDAAKITYEDNKDLYNKAEQREFETALTDRTNRVQAEKEQMQAIQNLALQAQLDGAPPAIVSEMMKSKTLADASALGGQFVGALDREQQRASIAQSYASIRSSNASAALNERALLNQEKAVEEGVLTPEQASLATDLRKERNGLQEVKDAKDLEGGFVGLISALDQENGVGDISAINSFQRLAVDPGVAVREGDVALLQSAQSFGDEAFLRAQGLMVGDKLTPEARTQMRNLSAQIYDSRVGFVEDNTAQLRTIAQENGIDYNKYIGKSFVDSATLIENMESVKIQDVTPTDTGISLEDGASYTLPNK